MDAVYDGDSFLRVGFDFGPDRVVRCRTLTTFYPEPAGHDLLQPAANRHGCHVGGMSCGSGAAAGVVL